MKHITIAPVVGNGVEIKTQGAMNRSRQGRRGAVVLLLAIFASLPLSADAFGQTIQEMRVRWDRYLPASPPQDRQSVREAASNVFTLLERRTFSGRPSRQRNPQISPDQILVIARDIDGELVDWQLIADPLILRSEQPGPNDILTGETFYRASADFLVTIPAEPSAKIIDFYHPKWTGTEFVFESMGTMALN